MGRNQEVANLLYQISKLLEMQGVPFKPRAYQRAALNIETLGEDIEKVLTAGRLGEIPGVGEAIAEKVKEYLTTGRVEYLDKLKKQVPEALLGLMSVPGIGPKTATRLWKELKVTSLADLGRAVKEHRLRSLKGFGEKSEEEIRRALGHAAQAQQRVNVFVARQEASTLKAHLVKAAGKRPLVFAGSFRRGRDTVGDLDLLAQADEAGAKKVVEAFVSYPLVDEVLEKGTTRSRVRLRTGLQVDLRVVPAASFGAAMVYFTGSKEHNIALRSLALKKGLTLNEYALATKKSGKPVAGKTEQDIYGGLGLDWIPPEMRENRGEIDLAAMKGLPRLVEAADLRGDLHTHTTGSDGAATLASMVKAAKRLGHEYLGISDHSAGLTTAGGLDAPRLRRQRQAIAKLQESTPRLRLFQGCEMEILKDGRLDLTPQARRDLDYILGSVHSSLQLPKSEQTKRVLRAMDEGIDILGHPTGRRIGKRPSIELDLESVAAKAKERGVLLEINANPDRLDLWGELVFACREAGASFVINSDAHTLGELEILPFGVTQARRGWATAKDIANTLPAAGFGKWIGHAKRG